MNSSCELTLKKIKIKYTIHLLLKKNKRNTFQLIIGGKIKTPHKIFINIIKVIY